MPDVGLQFFLRGASEGMDAVRERPWMAKSVPAQEKAQAKRVWHSGYNRQHSMRDRA